MTKTPQELEELAAEFENTDHTTELETAERINPPSEPMITFSLRVPRSTADKIRAEAIRQNRRPTALLRMWAEERLAGNSPADAPSGDTREEDIKLVRQALHEELAAAGLISRRRNLKTKRSKANFRAAEKSKTSAKALRRGRHQALSSKDR